MTFLCGLQFVLLIICVACLLMIAVKPPICCTGRTVFLSYYESSDVNTISRFFVLVVCGVVGWIFRIIDGLTEWSLRGCKVAAG